MPRATASLARWAAVVAARSARSSDAAPGSPAAVSARACLITKIGAAAARRGLGGGRERAGGPRVAGPISKVAHQLEQAGAIGRRRMCESELRPALAVGV